MVVGIGQSVGGCWKAIDLDFKLNLFVSTLPKCTHGRKLVLPTIGTHILCKWHIGCDVIHIPNRLCSFHWNRIPYCWIRGSWNWCVAVHGNLVELQNRLDIVHLLNQTEYIVLVIVNVLVGVQIILAVELVRIHDTLCNRIILQIGFPKWGCSWIGEIGLLTSGCEPHNFNIGISHQFQVCNLR